MSLSVMAEKLYSRFILCFSNVSFLLLGFTIFGKFTTRAEFQSITRSGNKTVDETRDTMRRLTGDLTPTLKRSRDPWMSPFTTAISFGAIFSFSWHFMIRFKYTDGKCEACLVEIPIWILSRRCLAWFYTVL